MARKIDPQDAQLATAEARGRELIGTAARAAEACYDPATGRVTIDLTNGCAYTFPARLVEDLNGATDDQLAHVEVDGLGFNLHWPALEADLYVPALVSGIFGTRAWMIRELASRAGQVSTPAKAAAARANGAKGGRPRKAAHAGGAAGDYFVTGHSDGEYRMLKPNAQRASDVVPTQAEAVAQSRGLNLDPILHVERVRSVGPGSYKSRK